MTIEAQLTDQIKVAMKARDQLRLDTLRAMKSAVKYKLVETKKDELSESEVITVFRSLLKQRSDSAEQFLKAGAEDRADKEKKEMAVISDFLPKALSAEELAQIVEQAVSKTGASSMKDMGAVMKEAQALSEGRADGKSLSTAVKQKLSS